MRYSKKNCILTFILLFLFTGCGVNYQYKTAERLKSEGRYQEAITRYKEVTKRYPTTNHAATSQFTIANIYLYKLKDYRQAKTEYQNFLKNYSADNRAVIAGRQISRIDQIIGLLSKAQENLKNERIKAAIEQFEEVLRLDPDSRQAKQRLEQAKQDLLSKARENLKNERIKEAMEGFKKVLELDPGSIQAKQGLEQARQEEIIEVKSRQIVICKDCGKVLSKKVKTVKIKRKEAVNYSEPEILQEQCFDCSLAFEIVHLARTIRAMKERISDMEYEIKYETPRAEMRAKAVELAEFVRNKYAPAAMQFAAKLNLYVSLNGGMALRDLAINHDFLDLIQQ